MENNLESNRSKRLIVGIDASRNRSGGARAHLIGILSEVDPEKHGIAVIHVWAFRSLLDQLPDKPFLVKHNPFALERSLIRQIFWQAINLETEAKDVGCDILFTTDASTFCRFKPMVVLSQDMLSYEPGVLKHYFFGRAWLRLVAILLLQNHAFRRSTGVIFLTRYAGEIIQRSCGSLKRITYIPHGIDSAFKEIKLINRWPERGERPVQCVYVSNADMYKHQWVVIEALALLRDRGYQVELKLIGGGEGRGQALIQDALNKYDPDGVVIEQLPFIKHELLPEMLAQADIFVFASSCENMPISLIEAMAVGLPIACSDRGPMPEVLGDAGNYFNPEDSVSIARAIEEMILFPEVRSACSRHAKALSQEYSWRRCSSETFAFISKVYYTARS